LSDILIPYYGSVKQSGRWFVRHSYSISWLCETVWEVYCSTFSFHIMALYNSLGGLLSDIFIPYHALTVWEGNCPTFLLHIMTQQSGREIVRHSCSISWLNSLGGELSDILIPYHGSTVWEGNCPTFLFYIMAQQSVRGNVRHSFSISWLNSLGEELSDFLISYHDSMLLFYVILTLFLLLFKNILNNIIGTKTVNYQV